MANKLLIVLNIAGLLGSLIWLMVAKDWEPLVTSIGLIATLVSLLYSNNQIEKRVKMNQKGGKNSSNYQSGRDINIRK